MRCVATARAAAAAAALLYILPPASAWRACGCSMHACMSRGAPHAVQGRCGGAAAPPAGSCTMQTQLQQAGAACGVRIRISARTMCVLCGEVCAPSRAPCACVYIRACERGEGMVVSVCNCTTSFKQSWLFPDLVVSTWQQSSCRGRPAPVPANISPPQADRPHHPPRSLHQDTHPLADTLACSRQHSPAPTLHPRAAPASDATAAC